MPLCQRLTHFILQDGFILVKVLFESIREITKFPEFLKILVDSVEFLDFFPFEFECLVNFECEFGDLLHRIIENFELLIDHANVVFHLSDRINTRNELAVVFKHQGLDFLIVDFDVLVDLIISSY